MASQGNGGDPSRPENTAAFDDTTSSQFPRSTAQGPPSIISSRMTDIASEDGGEGSGGAEGGSGGAEGGGSGGGSVQRRPSQRKSAITSDSRPGTAKTGVSSSRSGWPQSQALRKNYLSGLAAKRGSVGAGSVAGSVGRSPSTKSRSHVPSLQSHAFFHPMSSQKLQAQRGGAGGSRPLTMTQPPANLNDGAMASESAGAHQIGGRARQQQQLSDDGELQPPPSPGTEMTGLETLDRITANTSPTHGHHPQGSLTESMRPLQRKTPEAREQLNVQTDRSYRERQNNPSPLKSPRSFRSSFLMPGTNAQNSSSRNLEGAEKLSSGASSPQLGGRLEHSAKQPARSKPKTRLGRVYQYFQGNTIFCLGGRWQNTRSKPVNVATGVFVVAPCALYCIFSAPWLWRNISPAIPIVFAYLFCICFSSFVHASVSDPGILPRNLHQFPPPEDDDPLRLGPPTTDWVLVRSADATSAAMEVPVKHCRTCNIWRPPRAHHCRLCDNCIETHDHHCVWVNNCIGRRNYRYFFAFVASTTLLSLFMTGTTLTQMLVWRSQEQASFYEAMDEWRVPFALAIYGVVGLLYPAALMGYHLFLMARGETTREYINSHKFVKNERYRAFTQGGWFKNWVVVLCRPRPPTYYRFKKQYQQGDQRLAPARRGDKVVDDKKDRLAHSGGGGMEMEMQDVTRPATGGFQSPSTLQAQQHNGNAAT